MPQADIILQAFNRGRFSRLGLSRTDLDRVQISSEIQKNWVPRTLGSMMVRPGLKYLAGTPNDGKARMASFVRRTTDTYLAEVSSGAVRIWSSDVVLQVTGSTAAITNGTFDADLTGWTDADESVGASSTWITGGYMGLGGNKYTRAIRHQTVTAAAGDHHLAVKVNRGFPVLRVGSSQGGDDYFEATKLRPGDYSLVVASTGNFTIQFENSAEYNALVDSVSIESSGDISLPAPWTADELAKLRWQQVKDVLFVAGSTNRPRRIERYGTKSWSCVDYFPVDGPFRNINIDTDHTLTASDLSGNVTLEASRPTFRSGHEGALFEMTSIGQAAKIYATAANQWSNSIRVAGITNSRPFTVTISQLSTDVRVELQQSAGEEGNWINTTKTYASTASETFDDTADNEIIFYRIGVSSTGYTSTASGTATARLDYTAGGKVGRVLITSVVSATLSSAIVLDYMGSTNPTDLWAEGDWSDYRGWPTAVSLFEDRLSLAGRGLYWGSETGGYEDHDAETTGDAGPIRRSVSEGPSDVIEWLLPLNRLIIGTQSLEYMAKTTSLEEPITPTNFSLRDASGYGSASVMAIKVDKRGYFVQRGGTRIYEVGPTDTGLDHRTIDRTIIVPEIGLPAISHLAAQRQPDTRLHAVRTDGTVGMLVTEPAEDVMCWLDIDSTGASGVIEDVAVLPGTVEDNVYYIVRREVNGSTVRFVEKWEQESHARGGSSNRMADAFITQNSTATDTISGLDHLVAETVVAWGSGSTGDLGSFTVSSTGTITVPSCATTFTVGLPYEAWYKSAKLAMAVQKAPTLGKHKRIQQLGLIMADTHAKGVLVGRSTSTADLVGLPMVSEGVTLTTDTVSVDREVDLQGFAGTWNTDSRLILKGGAPRPATITAALIDMKGGR